MERTRWDSEGGFSSTQSTTHPAMSSSTPFEPMPATAAATIAKYHISSPDYPGHLDMEIGQAEHRIKFVNFWQLAPGSRVLEIGCGQGTTTAVLAEAVGASGHVDAVDPGPPEYGSPWTLAQAQEHLSGGPLGDRISWHFADPIDLLATNADKTWDYVVFAHCIWYFDSPATLTRMLGALKGRAETLLVAEYALKATELKALPHVLASVARATLEAHNKASAANIRCLSSPGAITEAASENGWALDDETNVVPGEGLMDGHWETGSVASAHFLKEIEENVEDPKVKALLRSARDGVLGALETVGVKKSWTMDVWVAKFH
ncbi:S-adenosyl-L-methionine-dependent methyltransferase [Trichoderma longibrachiatum]